MKFRLLPLSVFVLMLLTVFGLAASPSFAAPADTTAWERVDITSHPESGGTMLLVSGELPESTKLPAQAELSVPAGTALSWIGEILGGDPSADPTLEYERTSANGLDVYRFTLSKSRIAQIELSTTNVAQFDGSVYRMAMTWTPSQDTPEVRLSARLQQGAQVSQPATDAAMTPGDAGFSYYTRTVKNAKAGVPVDLVFAYTAPAAAATTGSASTTGSSNSFVLALLLVLSLGGLVGAGMAVRRKQVAQAALREAEATPVRAAPARRTQAAGTGKAKRVEAPIDTTASRSRRGIATLAVIGLVLVVGTVIVARGARPQVVDGTITQTFSQGQPCAKADVAVQLPAGVDAAASAKKLFDALRTVDGMNTATLDVASSSLAVDFCESSTTEEAVRAALMTTGLVSAQAPATQTAPAPAPATGTTSPPPQSSRPADAVQRIAVQTTTGSYQPSRLTAKAGEPIALTFDQSTGCLSDVVFPSLSIRKNLEGGPVTIDLPALEAGTYAFACGMDMQRGELVVQ